jgi:hypothetical protein
MAHFMDNLDFEPEPQAKTYEDEPWRATLGNLSVEEAEAHREQVAATRSFVRSDAFQNLFQFVLNSVRKFDAQIRATSNPEQRRDLIAQQNGAKYVLQVLENGYDAAGETAPEFIPGRKVNTASLAAIAQFSEFALIQGSWLEQLQTIDRRLNSDKLTSDEVLNLTSKRIGIEDVVAAIAAIIETPADDDRTVVVDGVRYVRKESAPSDNWK